MDGSPQHLRIYRSNRMEKLAEALGDVLSDAPADILAAECILVPGRGVAQWLSMRLAERFGVWSNGLYLYPRNFVSFALDRVLGKPGKALAAIDPERLTWPRSSNGKNRFSLSRTGIASRWNGETRG